MKTKRLFAGLLLNMLSGLPLAALSQPANHPQDRPAEQPAPSAADAGMNNMEHGTAQPQNAPPAKEMDHGSMQNMRRGTPVGSLPQSDGSAGKPLGAYGIVNDMDDNPMISMFMLDQFEYVHGNNDDSLAWDGRLRVGRDLDRFWVRSAGERLHGKTAGDVELLWGHVFAPFWDRMLGVRHDFGNGPSREWVGFGVQGLAPYKFQVEATAYLGESGRTAARLRTEYDLLLTQRLVFTPEIEANLYGKDDPEGGIGSGLADAALGVRLRYEIRREFAPYIGIGWHRKFGKTADFARADNEAVLDRRIMAGVRIWF